MLVICIEGTIQKLFGERRVNIDFSWMRELNEDLGDPRQMNNKRDEEFQEIGAV